MGLLKQQNLGRNLKIEKKKNSDVWCDFQVFQYNIDVKHKPKLVILGLI